MFPKGAGHCPALPARDNIPVEPIAVLTKDCKICPFNIMESRVTSVREMAMAAQRVQNRVELERSWVKQYKCVIEAVTEYRSFICYS